MTGTTGCAKFGQIQAPIRPMMGYNKRQAFQGPLTMTPLDARCRWTGHPELINVLAGICSTSGACQGVPGASNSVCYRTESNAAARLIALHV